MICLLLQVMTSYQENKQGNRLLECLVRHYTTLHYSSNFGVAEHNKTGHASANLKYKNTQTGTQNKNILRYGRLERPILIALGLARSTDGFIIACNDRQTDNYSDYAHQTPPSALLNGTNSLVRRISELEDAGTHPSAKTRAGEKPGVVYVHSQRQYCILSEDRHRRWPFDTKINRFPGQDPSWNFFVRKFWRSKLHRFLRYHVWKTEKHVKKLPAQLLSA